MRQNGNLKVPYNCRVLCNKSIFTFRKRGDSLVRPEPFIWGIAVQLIGLSLSILDDMISSLFTFIPTMTTRALLSCFFYAFTGWCWRKNCSLLMFRTKSSHLSEKDFLNSSFNNTISQAGDLGWMFPSDSIQSILIQLSACSEIHSSCGERNAAERLFGTAPKEKPAHIQSSEQH